MRTSPALLVTAAFSINVLASCSSDPRFSPPIATLAERPIEISGGVRTAGLAELAEGEGFDEVSTPAEFRGDVFIARIDRQTAAEIFGAPFLGVSSHVLTMEEADRAQGAICQTLCWLTAQESSLTLASGQRGYLAIENQIAYVKGFEMEATRGAVLLDPVIDEVSDGVRVHLRSEYESADGPWRVSMRLHAAEARSPLPMTNIPTHDGYAVTIQVPVFAHLEMASEAELGPGQALILAATEAFGGTGGVLIAILRPGRAAPVASHAE